MKHVSQTRPNVRHLQTGNRQPVTGNLIPTHNIRVSLYTHFSFSRVSVTLPTLQMIRVTEEELVRKHFAAMLKNSSCPEYYDYFIRFLMAEIEL